MYIVLGNILDPSDTVTVKGGKFTVNIENGQPKIYYPTLDIGMEFYIYIYIYVHAITFCMAHGMLIILCGIMITIPHLPYLYCITAVIILVVCRSRLYAGTDAGTNAGADAGTGECLADGECRDCGKNRFKLPYQQHSRIMLLFVIRVLPFELQGVKLYFCCILVP